MTHLNNRASGSVIVGCEGAVCRMQGQSLGDFRVALLEGGNVHVRVAGSSSFEVKFRELLKGY